MADQASPQVSPAPVALVGNSPPLPAQPSLARLSLDSLRGDLIRLEETIIFSLIERAQFKQNPRIYQAGAITDKFGPSFLDFFLCETEKVHSLMRRYTSPDEHPFFPEQLLTPVLPLLDFPLVIKPNSINYNPKIKTLYLERILPQICKPGDDQQYGSSANCDILTLQALSKRIHYGKFVAEAKYQEKPDYYDHLIRTGAFDEIRESLINKAVEQRLLERVERKASTYGKEFNAPPNGQQAEQQFKVQPTTIVSLYRDYMIPLTIDVEVEYMLHRLEKPVVAFLGPTSTFSHMASMQYFGHSSAAALLEYEFRAVPTIGRVFDEVLTHHATFGVVPVENSITGRVAQTMEHLFDTKCHVLGEVYLPISHNLLAINTVPTTSSLNEEIEHVYSHPQALAQCAQWLRRHLPNAKLHETSSTAEAAALVKSKSLAKSAALASAMAATTQGLHIVAANCQDISENYTRFLVLAKQNPSAATGKDKTILTFGTKHQAGALAAVINSFAKAGLNLEALESFPDKIAPFAYNFYVEVDGHPSEPNVGAALDELKDITTFVNILGGFAAAPKPVFVK